jgi:hypothetical protein
MMLLWHLSIHAAHLPTLLFQPLVQGFGAEYVALNYERTREALYLHERWTRVRAGEAGFQIETC